LQKEAPKTIMPRDLKPPFKFDISGVVNKFRKLPVKVEGGVNISLPFFQVTVKPDAIERTVAREVVIRLADRRVLNAFECCDNCIENALKSLQEIRAIIVDKQVELSGKTDGPVYLLLDAMRDGIRQFLTFEQRLSKGRDGRELYFAGLEMLRAHIHRSLIQISKIARMKIPGIAPNMRYDEDWQMEAYTPLLPESETKLK
jgi:hypothetical protein